MNAATATYDPSLLDVNQPSAIVGSLTYKQEPWEIVNSFPVPLNEGPTSITHEAIDRPELCVKDIIEDLIEEDAELLRRLS